MTLYEVQVEMELPTSGRINPFIEALDIASGVFGRNEWGNLHALFTIAAVSHRQAVWRALDRITHGAHAAGLPPEPVTLRLLRTDTERARQKIVRQAGEECECVWTYTSA